MPPPAIRPPSRPSTTAPTDGCAPATSWSGWSTQWLQYRKVGPWRSYAVGEAAYVVLSLTAKSAPAGQVFGGALTGCAPVAGIAAASPTTSWSRAPARHVPRWRFGAPGGIRTHDRRIKSPLP